MKPRGMRTTLWRTYTMLTDLEAVFRGLKSDLGLRPVFHHKETAPRGICSSPCWPIKWCRSSDASWRQRETISHGSGLRAILAVQQRITATFRQRDGQTLHVRKATVAEPDLRQIYDALQIDPAPGGIRKYLA